jgi:7-keto-8-aminopelargonate synthetase-like enzyme
MTLVRPYDASFAEHVILVVDDSHGVGAFGATGRGTEEYIGCVIITGQVKIRATAYASPVGCYCGLRVLVLACGTGSAN